jgi:radical SAM protein with 4Fe4S-binding SPASM domain
MARRYYYPGGEKTSLEKVRNRLFRKPVPKFPRTVVIETQFGCNAGCVFCQYPQIKDQLPRGRMEMATFEKIVRECAGRPVERFILCLGNEPLLDRALEEKFALLRQFCPRSKRNLTTNASLLTPERVESLIASGCVNELFLSINGYSREVYEELMKLPFGRTMANLDSFCSWLRAHPDARESLRIRVNVVRTRRVAPEIAPMRRRWREKEGFEFHVIDLDNRGAQLDMRREDALAPDRPDMRPNTNCRRLFHTLVITWEGRAVICCVDYKREVVLGNVHEQTIDEIWNGPRATQLRKEYLAGDFTHLKPCRTCQINA